MRVSFLYSIPPEEFSRCFKKAKSLSHFGSLLGYKSHLKRNSSFGVLFEEYCKRHDLDFNLEDVYFEKRRPTKISYNRTSLIDKIPPAEFLNLFKNASSLSELGRSFGYKRRINNLNKFKIVFDRYCKKYSLDLNLHDVVSKNVNNSKIYFKQFLDISKAHQASHLKSVYKASAKYTKRVFALDDRTFANLIFNKCFYCGVNPTTRKVSKNNKTFILEAHGIDRLDSNLDYTIDNTVSCCFKCNRMKSDLKQADFIEHVKRVYQHQLNLGNII